MALQFHPHARQRLKERGVRRRFSSVKDSRPNSDEAAFEGILHSMQNGMGKDVTQNRWKFMPSKRVPTGW